MHFFSPANVMRLLRDRARRQDRAGRAGHRDEHRARRSPRCRRVVGVCHGFVGNRMLAQRGSEAEKLLLEGALPQEVDAVLYRLRLRRWDRSRWAISPASTSAGARARTTASSRRSRDALCEAGRFGQKTGKGYYKYEAGSRSALPDPEVEKLIDETLAAARPQAAHRQRRRDPRAPDVPDDQRGREDPRRGHRGASVATSTWSGSTATAGRSIAAARCSGPTASASSTSPTVSPSTPRRPTTRASSPRRC